MTEFAIVILAVLLGRSTFADPFYVYDFEDGVTTYSSGAGVDSPAGVPQLVLYSQDGEATVTCSAIWHRWLGFGYQNWASLPRRLTFELYDFSIGSLGTYNGPIYETAAACEQDMKKLEDGLDPGVLRIQFDADSKEVRIANKP